VVKNVIIKEMEKQENLAFFVRLLKAKSEIGKVLKNAKNPHFKNTYADINAVVESVESHLIENGLILLQPIQESKQFSVIQDAYSESKIESYLDLPQNLNPQQMGSAITYFRRYTLQSLLSLRAEDDDANGATNTPQAPAKTQETQKQKENFTEDKFQKAYENNATMEQITTKYILTDKVKQKYIDFVFENDSKKVKNAE
jgi:ERF superfamily